MKPETEELIKAERRRDNFSYIADVIQRGRIRPSTFTHEIGIPYDIYEAMSNRNLIDHEYFFLSKTAFFEFRNEEVIVSFNHLYLCEDFHHLVDRFIIRSLMGNYPIRRTGISKMNFDEKVEKVQHVFNKKIKGNDNIITLGSDL